MPFDQSDLKVQLRRDARAGVSMLGAGTRAAADTAIADGVLGLLPRGTARTWCIAAYAALPTEVQTDALLRALCARYGGVVLPVYDASGAPALARCTDVDALVPSTHDVPMPPEPREYVDPSTLDVIIVPGLAFDRAGGRLGRGGGFYDRLLPHVGGRRIGIAYDIQVMPAIPVEAHDARVDHVVTEAHVYTARGWRFDSFDAPC